MKMTVTNFINKKSRTYLIVNPDIQGNGKEIGYYRYNPFKCNYAVVVLIPYYDDKEFPTEKESQDWLTSKINH